MIAYNETLATFKKHVESNTIVNQISSKLGFKASDSLIRSFKNSLGEMYKVLSGSKVPNDSRIGIEYKIPITTRRIDFIVSGSDGTKNYIVIVELKQWDRVIKSDMPNIVYLGNQEHTHPSWQAYSYAATLNHFNEAIFKHQISISPATFLHNYKPQYLDQLVDDIYRDAIELAPVFIESDYLKLRKFIEKYIKIPAQKDLLFEIEQGKIKPSKMLVDAIGNMLNNNPEFILLDEQKIVSEYLYHIATKNIKDSKKHVVIVEGGAGTGKSVIAIDLLGKLITKKAYTAFYVAKSSYLKENYYNKLTKGIPNYSYLRTLFKGSGNFIDASLNEFNCLIVDEAHRLTKRTKRGHLYFGENQIKEIIHASQISIFFIDPKQQIDLKDFGTIDQIKTVANSYNATVHHHDSLKLKAQFRCNGSDDYMALIDSILYDEPIEVNNSEFDYDVKIFDDINELKIAIIEKNANNKSRMISGDVFPWLSRADKTAIDIKLNGFEAQWNRTKAFATDPKAIDEVGCIHTVQGMEFDYAGVIIGDDLVYRNGKIETDYTKHPLSANEFKRPHQRRVFEEDIEKIDILIRNTYRVLLSRGQMGTYIFCFDNQLANYLKNKFRLF